MLLNLAGTRLETRDSSRKETLFRVVPDLRTRTLLPDLTPLLFNFDQRQIVTVQLRSLDISFNSLLLPLSFLVESFWLGLQSSSRSINVAWLVERGLCEGGRRGSPQSSDEGCVGTGGGRTITTAQGRWTAIELEWECASPRHTVALHSYSTASIHKAQPTVHDEVDSAHCARGNTCRDGAELYPLIWIDAMPGLQPVVHLHRFGPHRTIVRLMYHPRT